MSPSADAPTPSAISEALNLTTGQIVQEIGYDDDVDHDLRDAIEDLIGEEMEDEDTQEIVDAVVLWWRDDDGDVADGLVDAMTDLTDKGIIWLLTPKVGRSGFIDPSSVAEGVTIAGLSLTRTANVAPDWQATKVVRPKNTRR